MIRFLSLLFFAVMLYSCEELVEFPDSGSYVSQVVIEAQLTDENKEQYVKVSYSTSVEDSVLGIPVTNARVWLLLPSGDTVNYSGGQDGIYHAYFKAAENTDYRLEVSVNGIVYASTGKAISMNGIDSLYCRHLINPENGDSAYYIYMNAGESYPDDSRYYMIDIFKNGNLTTYGSDIWIFSDNYTDSIDNIKLPASFEKSDTVLIELSSLTKTMFDYYFKLSYEVFSLDLSNISYRCNLPRMFEPQALGYFQVSCVSQRQIIIK